MTTPTDPSKWALEETDKYKSRLVGGSVEGIEFVDISWKYVRSILALALDAARRRGIEEASRWLAPNFPGQARDMVRDLASKEST